MSYAIDPNLSLDGVDDHIVLPGIGIHPANKIVSLDLKYDGDFSESQLIFSNGGGLSIGIQAGGQLLTVSAPLDHVRRPVLLPHFIPGEWNKIEITYDENYVPTCFINGQETDYISEHRWGPDPGYFIGRRNQGQYLNGKIRGLQIWDENNEVIRDYRFSEATGTIAHDSSGNGYHGEIIGAQWRLSRLKRAHATKYDGVDDYAVTTDQYSLQQNGLFSIGLWFRGRNLQDTQFIFGKSFAVANCWSFRRHADGGIRFEFSGSGTPVSRWNLHISSSLVNEVNRWYHLCLTYDTGVAQLYLDGVIMNSGEYPLEGNFDNPNQDVFFGVRGNSFSFWLDGDIRESFIVDRLLNPEQIQHVMENGFDRNDPDLRGYWPANEGTGSILHDRSPHGNHATIHGASWITTSEEEVGEKGGNTRLLTPSRPAIYANMNEGSG